jgi:hypothetical protein
MSDRGAADPRRSQRQSIVERPVPKGRNEVTLSLFAFFFGEVVRLYLTKSKNSLDLEGQLERLGEPVGVRVYELCVFRDRSGKRDVKLLQILQFLHTNLWKTLFGRPADGIERSTESEDEYMIADKSPLVNRFISMPRDMQHLNCAAYVAGILKGALDAAGFPAKVTAHTVEDRTVYLMKFEQSVIEREKRLK